MYSIITDSSFETSFQNNKETNSSNIQTNSQESEQDYIRIFRDIGIPIITLLAGIISAKYIVGSWQKTKEISDIRKAILENYNNSFKNYITLMDTFVAKLVMEFAKLTDNKPANKTALSELLPWGFTFNDLHYSPKKFHKYLKDDNLKDFKNKVYKKNEIEKKFKSLGDVNKESYIDFEYEKLNVFKNNNETIFKEDFFQTRNKLMGFIANLSQYYEDSTHLSGEFSAMWEYMMACYILVNKILDSENEQKFIESVNEYNISAEFLFDIMINYERKLIDRKINLTHSKFVNRIKKILSNTANNEEPAGNKD